MTDEKWSTITAYLDQVIREPDKYPDYATLLSFTDEEMTQIFTKRRMELIHVIRRKKPKNVSELSKAVGRQVSAVLRDLKLLKSYGIVGLKKDGKNMIPHVKKSLLIIPLVEVKPKTLAELMAEA